MRSLIVLLQLVCVAPASADEMVPVDGPDDLVAVSTAFTYSGRLNLGGVAVNGPAELRFTLHPSLQLLASRWPIASLWAGDDADMKKGQVVAVIRPALNVELRILPPGGHGFVTALAAGATLDAAAEAAVAREPDFDLATHLQGLFALGAVVALMLPDPD